jgi:prepilin-type N-terminal cleavage/methylation domain-containing protein
MSLPRTDAEMGVRGNLRSQIRSSKQIRSLKSENAFTLIELVVVISVIAILMALLFPAFRGVQDQAKTTQAKNDLTQIVTAVNAYYTEYGKYPMTFDTADITLDGLNNNTNDKLFNGLRGQDSTVNPKNVVFIAPPAVKDDNNPRSGISGLNGQYFDPWGKPYIIRMDTTYDNLVTPNPYLSHAGFAANVNGGVIAWSFGKDNLSDSVPGPAPDKNTGTNVDDVISWQ